MCETELTGISGNLTFMEDLSLLLLLPEVAEFDACLLDGASPLLIRRIPPLNGRPDALIISNKENSFFVRHRSKCDP